MKAILKSILCSLLILGLTCGTGEAIRFSAVTEATTPVDADSILIHDASIPGTRRVTFTNLWSNYLQSKMGAIGDGSVEAPGLAFSSDNDTGIYRIGANNLGIAVNGTKIVDVGVDGTSFPLETTFLSFSATAQPSFRAWRNATQTLSGGETTLLINDESGVAGWDTGSWFNTSNYTATVPSDGVYLLHASALFNVAAANDTLLVRIKLNGTTVLQGQTDAANENGENEG